MMALVLLLSVAAAVLTYGPLEALGRRGWAPAACRAAGWGALGLLLLNVSCPAALDLVRPIVLLDASLSMGAAGGRWVEALTLARETGEPRTLGGAIPDSLPTEGGSRLGPALAAARSSGRPVVVVTDGELEDGAELSPGLVEGVQIRVLAREPIADLALIRAGAPARITAGDSLRVRAEVRAMGGPARAVQVEVAEGDRVWFRASATPDSAGLATLMLAGVLPEGASGTLALTVRLRASDREPRDDARLHLLTVVPTPGVVLLAGPPTWESRFLLSTLETVAALPVRGYARIEAAGWRRMDDLRPAPAREVEEAVRRADLLVTLGDVGDLARRTRARGRWEWPATSPGAASLSGDWYLALAPATPVDGSLAGLPVDSFPPATALVPLVESAGAGEQAWTGLTAQLARRGAVRPALVGRDSGGVRRVTVAVDGIWRWAFQGGSSEQAYRSLMAATVSWLLGGSDSVSGRARPVRSVVQRGRPVTFAWTGSEAPVPTAIELAGPTELRRDTLVFDGAGRAEMLLAPGVYRYRLEAGGGGLVGVEEYSDEFVPRPVVVDERGFGAGMTRRTTTARDHLWLFALAVLALSCEWFLRRRMGLR